MDETETIDVKPIYGAGWAVAGNARYELPAPFTIRVEHADGERWSGIILDSEHEFEGQRATLSRRHIPFMGYVNITIKPLDSSKAVSTGFGILAEYADIVSPPIRG